MLRLIMEHLPSPGPHYDHLREVLDGAASLSTAIRQAENALNDPDLGEESRTLIESVLEASRERLSRIEASLRRPASEGVEAQADDDAGLDREWSEHDLIEAGRAAGAGSPQAEHQAARAIDRMGRALRLGARSSIETFLGHPSPLLRAASMKVLALHWRLKEYTDRVLWSLACDQEADCRRAAALCLGSLYEGTKDRLIGRDLAAVIARENEDEDVRWASYYALLDLEGRSREGRPLPFQPFDADLQADPEIVARYADHG
ncbi:MAG TPA: hypothetical protein VGK94_05225 [Candidatus Polarisedimenticolia bacterium]|jgi:hypothetical protein